MYLLLIKLFNINCLTLITINHTIIEHYMVHVLRWWLPHQDFVVMLDGSTGKLLQKAPSLAVAQTWSNQLLVKPWEVIHDQHHDGPSTGWLIDGFIVVEYEE